MLPIMQMSNGSEVPQQLQAMRQPDPYVTKLSPQQELLFQKWRTQLPKNLQYDGDYDLRGLWAENPNVKPSPNLHFTDKYKKPNHPTFSDESVYFNPNTRKYAGRWRETDSTWEYHPYDMNIKKKIVEKKY